MDIERTCPDKGVYITFIEVLPFLTYWFMYSRQLAYIIDNKEDDHRLNVCLSLVFFVLFCFCFSFVHVVV